MINSRHIGLLAMAALLFAAVPGWTQPAVNANAAQQVVSPEISTDGPTRSLTFRLYAPNAKAVTLNGDFTLAGLRVPPMTRDTNGVWTDSVDSLTPGIYGYYFRVDGVRIPDPGNLFISSGAEFLKSYVDVAGVGPTFWSVRDVPHGEVHELWYRNPALGQRHLLVYTPPGYDAAAVKTYPTVYLLHAGTDNETFWTRMGKVNFIMDNLIADGKAKPAILVMPFGHKSVPPGPEEGTNVDDLYNAIAIGQDITEVVIPLVEREFRAGKTAGDRAIYGFAMGGFQAVTIGLNHPGVFGYVCGASATFRPNADPAGNFKGLNANLETAKTNLKYLGLMTGSSEANGTPPAKGVADYLTGLGLKTEWSMPKNGRHTWQTWRTYFYDLMQRKFFVDDPYSTPTLEQWEDHP